MYTAVLQCVHGSLQFIDGDDLKRKIYVWYFVSLGRKMIKLCLPSSGPALQRQDFHSVSLCF